jgi:hypothetical protein
MKPSSKLIRLALLAATLPLAACETLTQALTSSAGPAPVNSRGAVQAFPPLTYNSYCEAQRAIAEANSRRDTLKTGKTVVYKAPCDLNAKPAPKTPAKTVQQEPATI